MAEGVIERIAMCYRSAHGLVLELVDRLNDEHIQWRPGKMAPSIGFHVWHLARWADYLQEMIRGGGQVWETEGLAGTWGLHAADLGFAGTGLGMDDEASASLVLPGKDALLAYARRAFAEADQAVGQMSEADFPRMVADRHGAEWKEVEVGDAVLSWLRHDNRHLGMIECLVGVQGLRGTATR